MVEPIGKLSEKPISSGNQYLVTLFASSLLSFSIGMVVPFGGPWIREALGAGYLAVALVVAVPNLVAAIALPIWGWWCDRGFKRSVMIEACFGSAGGFLLLSFVHVDVYWFAAYLFGAETFIWGYIVSGISHIGMIYPGASPEGKRKQQSRLLLYLATGSTLQGMGSMFSGNLQAQGSPFQSICIWAAVIGFIAFFISFSLEEVKRSEKVPSTPKAGGTSSAEEVLKETPRKAASLASVVTVGFLFYASMQLIMPYAGILFLTYTGPGREDLLGLSMLYSALLSFIAILVVTLLADHLSVHARERLFRILLFGFAIAAMVMVLTWYYLLADLQVVMIIFTIPVLSPVNTILQVMVFSRVPQERRGRGISKLNSALFLANFLGAALAGYVQTEILGSMNLLFAFIPASLALAATVMFTCWLLPPRKGPYDFPTE